MPIQAPTTTLRLILAAAASLLLSTASVSPATASAATQDVSGLAGISSSATPMVNVDLSENGKGKGHDKGRGNGHEKGKGKGHEKDPGGGSCSPFC